MLRLHTSGSGFSLACPLAFPLHLETSDPSEQRGISATCDKNTALFLQPTNLLTTFKQKVRLGVPVGYCELVGKMRGNITIIKLTCLFLLPC